MGRKTIELHRSSDNVNCREYGESYVKYYYEPNDCSINNDMICIDTSNQSISKEELVNNDIILSNILNLGKLIYDKYLHNDIIQSSYLFDRKIKVGSRIIPANTFDEFIELEIWNYPEIETTIIEWFKSNPYYGSISKDTEIINYSPINLYKFVTISVMWFMIYKLYNIAYKNHSDININQPSLLSIFSDLLKQTHKTKDSYTDSINHMSSKMVISNCISMLCYISSKDNPTKYYTKIFNDGSVAKIHYSLLSVAFETLISKVCCHSREITTCSNCGNYYPGHGNSTLCIPCRIYKDNHKHIKSDRT